LGREYAARHGLRIVNCFSDAGVSGSTPPALRQGLKSCLEAARRGEFDVLLVEAVDRISRSQAHTAAIHDELSFLDIKLHSVSQGGEVVPMMVGMLGIMNQHHLHELAVKTRRGQAGNVRKGLIPGGLSYGYDLVPNAPGERTINQAEAAIVRRIFEEYARRLSALDIVKGLNRDGIPSPRGGRWNASTINGNRRRRNGILSNVNYIGQIDYNRQRFKKDPATGNRQARLNAADDWVRNDEVPHLRIID
jgi:DNA invertase Pin-like site-specific DNA recombinase